MPDQDDDLVARVEELSRQLCLMEARVGRLEKRDAYLFGAEAHPLAPGAARASLLAVPPRPSESALALTGRTIVTLGGGYLVRAMTDAGLLPGMGVVGLGLAYASLWMVFAERSAAAGLKASAAFHGIASTLIAYPLLWETTTRFGLLQPPHTLAILVLVFAAGIAVAVHRGLVSLAWVTTYLALGTTAGLLIFTHFLLPAVVALMAIAGAVEYLAFRGLWLGMRWPAALALDAGLLILVVIASDPAGLPQGYPAVSLRLAIATALAVPGIYLVNIVARTLGRGYPVTPFETVQATTALILGFGGAWKLSGSQGAVATELGRLSVLLGGLCYATAFVFVERRAGHCRNFYFYTLTGGVLALAGSRVIFAEPVLTLAWSGCALLFAWLGCRFHRLTLRFHSAVYLCAAAFHAGLLGASWTNFFGPSAGPWMLPTAAGWMAAATAVACYAIFCSERTVAAQGWDRLPRGIASWVGAWILGGAVVAALGIALNRLVSGNPAAIATLRTAVLALLVLGLGWATRRWSLRELTWLVYALLAAGGLKLLTEDLRQGQAAALFLSLVFYGGALTVAPRLVRSP